MRLEGSAETIHPTPLHPFWCENRETWTSATDLEPGDLLRTADGRAVRVESIDTGDDGTPVFNIEVDGDHVYRVGDSGILVHNASDPCACLEEEGHYAEWCLKGPKGGHLGCGDEESGLDFPLPPGTRLSFPDQSWYGHTEGKIIAELGAAGRLQCGRTLLIEGCRPPCPGCRNVMKWASGEFNMSIIYVDCRDQRWAWKNGERLA